MPDQDLNSNYTDLISRYLSGNASDAEVRELETWVLASPENKAQFIASKKAWMLSGLAQDSPQVDVGQLWEKTAGELFGKAREVEMKKGRPLRRWLGIAAGIGVLAVAAIWLVLSLSDRNSMRLEATFEVKTFDLPDGSKITLNQSSSIKFSPKEGEGERKLSLKGDAFFDVARDEAHPFIIRTQGIEIEVLGTSFYVDSRPDQPEIQVIVQSGSVRVRSGSSETVLGANEKAVFRKRTRQLQKEENQDPNYRSIMTDSLTFNNTGLEEVVFALNRHYNASIFIAITDLEKCEINTTFEDKSLEAILLILEQTLGIQSSGEGKQIVLSGERCR